ncbi:phosphoglycerate kinase [Patescibacteria group bacterium]|nr:phosphoglycerate kinase [Patescibacteria group bacterium]
MRWLSDFALKGKRVLLRADFNVPLKENGDITDDFRIKATLPTMQHILSQGGKLIIMSHLGDPLGVYTDRLNMQNVAKRLTELLLVSVERMQDCIGKEIEERTKNMREGEILLLENLRFHKEEEENDENFAKELAKLADVYVLDAFGVVHRTHASVVGVPALLPSVGGFLLAKEIEGLLKLKKDPEHPMVAIIGGRKIESKLPVIDSIAEFADEVLLGNLLANEITQKNISLKKREKVVFPLDGIPGNGKEYDIGPKTRKLYQEKVRNAKTVFWAGPLGKYEEKEYAGGSKIIAESIVERASYAVAGGGNLLDFLGRYNLRDKFDHISTGGSSMLIFLAGEKLPGLEALNYYGN